jgi:hypothetical protein
MFIKERLIEGFQTPAEDTTTTNNEKPGTTTIDIDIFIIKTIQEFVFFFSFMFLFHYLKKTMFPKGTKRTESYYILIGFIVLNVIVNMVKVIIYLKKILSNNCSFKFLNSNDDTL